MQTSRVLVWLNYCNSCRMRIALPKPLDESQAVFTLMTMRSRAQWSQKNAMLIQLIYPEYVPFYFIHPVSEEFQRGPRSIGRGICSHHLTSPNLWKGYKMCVTLPTSNRLETGPYVLLSIVVPGRPSPSTQICPLGILTSGKGYGGRV